MDKMYKVLNPDNATQQSTAYRINERANGVWSRRIGETVALLAKSRNGRAALVRDMLGHKYQIPTRWLSAVDEEAF